MFICLADDFNYFNVMEKLNWFSTPINFDAGRTVWIVMIRIDGVFSSLTNHKYSFSA